jgi:hypothetical protein
MKKGNTKNGNEENGNTEKKIIIIKCFAYVNNILYLHSEYINHY